MQGLKCALSSVAVLALSGSYAGAGDFSCVVEDKALSLALNGKRADAPGYGLVDATGSAAVKFDGTPSEVGPIELNRQSLAQYWFQNGELEFYITGEKAVAGKSVVLNVLLDLKKVRNDPTTYRGRYALDERHSNPKTTGVGIINKAGGYAECTAD